MKLEGYKARVYNIVITQNSLQMSVPMSIELLAMVMPLRAISLVHYAVGGECCCVFVPADKTLAVEDVRQFDTYEDGA